MDKERLKQGENRYFRELLLRLNCYQIVKMERN